MHTERSATKQLIFQKYRRPKSRVAAVGNGRRPIGSAFDSLVYADNRRPRVAIVALDEQRAYLSYVNSRQRCCTVGRLVSLTEAHRPCGPLLVHLEKPRDHRGRIQIWSDDSSARRRWYTGTSR